MATFAEARFVLEANAAPAGQAVQFPQELASFHSPSVAQICAKCFPVHFGKHFSLDK
jgi:hypothetical protein